MVREQRLWRSLGALEWHTAATRRRRQATILNSRIQLVLH